jgi:DNA-binding transcriptional ArsR family regulator
MKSKDAVAALAALAQETRMAVYRELVQQGPSGLAAGEIAAAVGTSPTTLSFHLKEMAHAGLVVSRQEGRFVYYAANYAVMNELLGYLTENCCAADCGTANCRPVNARASASPPRPSGRKPQRERTKA